MFQRLLVYITIMIFTPLSATPTDVSQTGACRMIRISPERLSDLTLPRSGHNIFYVNSELTVVGGHTTNFAPTQTAEYYADGIWHQLPTAYSHDNGFAVVLQSGEVIIGGGHSEPLGVGQTFVVERYTPTTHSFEGFGSLDQRRTLANASLLKDGRVIIAGNNYGTDAIGCYDGRSQVQHVKSLTQGHSNPYILPIAADDAIIIGGRNTRQDTPDTVWADRVRGAPFRVPLLERWRLVYTDQPFSSRACATGDYTYLLTVTDESGQMGIAQMRDTCFTLLSTVCPIPMEGPFGPVFYKGPIVVDSLRQRGYVMGVDSLYNRQYLLRVDYSQRPAALTLYYTDTIAHATITIPIVTPDGDVILAGGIPNDNYKPLSSVWRYHFSTETATVQPSPLVPGWLWVVTVLTAVAAIMGVIYYRNRANGTKDNRLHKPNKPGTPKSPELMDRICQLMDEQQLYCNSELKASDVAALLGTNSRYVTDSIRECRDMTFTQFINDYRIRYIQQLLRQNPDRKIIEVYTEAGFASERSFFRIFKETTGMTTSEWLSKNVGRQ